MIHFNISNMKISNSILHRLHFLVALSALSALPNLTHAADIDLVGSSLEGWTLLYGSRDVRNNTFFWNSSTIQSYYNQQNAYAYYYDMDSWNSDWWDHYYSGSAGVTSSATKYAPDWNWAANASSYSYTYQYQVNSGKGRPQTVTINGKGDIGRTQSDEAYRYFVYSSAEDDPMFGNTSKKPSSVSYTLKTVPDGYSNAVRLGSSLYNFSATYPYGSGAEFNNFRDYNYVLPYSQIIQYRGSYYLTPGFTLSAYYNSAPLYNACAEGMTKTFTVDADHQLLVINYATVARLNAKNDSHSSSNAPYFDIIVTYKKVDGTTGTLSGCNSIKHLPSTYAAQFPSVKDESNKVTYYATDGWQFVDYDLSELGEGTTVTISVLNSDCYSLTSSGNSYTEDDDHYGYAYFTARLTDIPKINVKYCTDSDPVAITVPSGFTSYDVSIINKKGTAVYTKTVKASDITDGTITLDNDIIKSYPNVASIRVICDGCLTYTHNYEISTIYPSNTVRQDCDKKVTLINTSTFSSTSDKAEKITWKVYDYSDDLNVGTRPTASNTYKVYEGDSLHLNNSDYPAECTSFNMNGQWVEMTVTNSYGCEASTNLFYVVPNPELLWKVLENPTFCVNKEVVLKFLSDDNYTGNSGSLRFKFDGQSDTYSIGRPITVANKASQAVSSYKYTVTDGLCSVSGDYPIKVLPTPKISLVDADKFTTVNKVPTLYLCHGESADVSVYSEIENVRVKNTKNTTYENLTLNTADNKYYSSVTSFPVGTYTFSSYIKENNVQCSSSQKFAISEYTNSVRLSIPASSVCSTSPVTVSVLNAEDPTTVEWWAEDASGNKSAIQHGGENYHIEVPSDAVTYHCTAKDANGCEFNETFSFSLQSQIHPTVTFRKNVSKPITDETPDGHSSHYHKLTKICSSDSLFLNSLMTELAVASTKYSWTHLNSLSDNPTTWYSDSVTTRSFKLDSLRVYDEGETSYILLKSQPFNSAGIELCGSIDTIEVATYPKIVLSSYVDGTKVVENSEFSVCDELTADVKAVAAWADASETSSFTIKWNDYGHSVNPYTGWTDNVQLYYDDAEYKNERGRFYKYNYTVTSEGSGCQASDSFRIYVKPTPSISVPSAKGYVCAGSDFTISCTDNNNDLDASTVSDLENTSVSSWTFSNSLTSETSTQASPTYTVALPGEGNLYIKATANNGCSSTLTYPVAIAPLPKIKVEAIPYYNNINNSVRIDHICGYSVYKLLVSDENKKDYDCSDSVWVRVQKKNGYYDWLRWSKNSSNTKAYPYVDSTYSKDLTSALNYNNGSAAMFSYYRAQSNTGSTDKYDNFTITYTNECGCTASVDYQMRVTPTPAVSYLGERKTKDFLCQGENMNLQVQVKNGSTSDKYYWVRGWHSPGDTAASQIIKKGLASDAGMDTLNVSYNPNAGYNYYSFQVQSSECVAETNIYVYNVVKPTFSLDINPTILCEGANSEITLNASSGNLKVYYYTYDKDGNLPATNQGVTDSKNYLEKENYWGEGVTTSTINTSDYEPANQVCVVAATPVWIPDTFVVKSNNFTKTRLTNSRYFCFSDSICKSWTHEPSPTLSYYITDANGNKITNNTLCAGSQYYIVSNNSLAQNTTNDEFTLTNTDDNQSYTLTTAPGEFAKFGPFNTLSDAGFTNYTLSVSSNTTDGLNLCAGEKQNIKIETKANPVVTIGVDGWGDDVDSVSYCRNLDGVVLKANITNKNAASDYTYNWKNSISQTFSTPEVTAKLENVSSHSYSIDYTLQVTDNVAGCQSNIVTCKVTPVDTSAFSVADYALGCKGGYARLYLQEAGHSQTYNNDSIRFEPAYEYHAYKSNIDAEYLDELVGEGSSLTDGRSKWYIQNCYSWGSKYYGKKRVDTCGSTNLRFYFRLPMESGNLDYFMFTKTDKKTKCVSRLFLRYEEVDVPQKDKISFAIRFNSSENVTETVNRTIPNKVEKDEQHHIYMSQLAADGSDTIAYSCPGDKPIFNVKDSSHYDIGGYQIYNMWKKSTVYNSVNGEITQYRYYNKTKNQYSSWFTPALSQGAGRTTYVDFNPNISVTGTSEIELQAQTYYAGCYTVGSFYITMANTPVLSYLRDYACVYDSTGKFDATLKFKAQSDIDASNNAVEHHYTWWDADNKSYLYPNISNDASKENSETYFPVPVTEDIYHSKIGTGSYVTYYYYLHDQPTGYCEANPIRVESRLYQNPVFSVNLDPTPACLGNQVTTTVRFDYNYGRNNTASFYKGKTATGKATNMSNNLAVGRTFTDKFIASTQHDTVFYTAFFNYNQTQTYTPNKKLGCYTTNYAVFDAFETPSPVLRLVKKSKVGAYDEGDIVMTVSKEADTDSTGSRKICPGDDYYYALSNADPDVLNKYTTSTTNYTIKDLTDDAVMMVYQDKLSTDPINDDLNVFTANNHKYSISAVSSNGCSSPTYEFELPLSVNPTVKISEDGVACAGNTNNTVTLTATADGGDSFTYQWYKTSVINDANAIDGATTSTYPLHPVSNENKRNESSADFSVVAKNQDMCQTSDYTTVKVVPLPLFDLKASDNLVCIGDEVTLTMQKSDTEDYYNNGEEFTYTWTESGDLIDKSANAVTTSPIKVSADTRMKVTASVQVTDKVYCSDTLSVPVKNYQQVVPELRLIATAKSGLYNDGDIIPDGGVVCEGASFYPVFKAEPVAGCSEYTYHFVDKANGHDYTFVALAGQEANLSKDQIFSLKSDTEYEYYVSTECGCASPHQTVSVKVASAPTISITGDEFFCQNSNRNITITAKAEDVDEGKMSWAWADPLSDKGNTNTVTFLPTAVQSFSVTGTNTENGCAAQATWSVSLKEAPVLSISAPEAVCKGGSVSLTAQNLTNGITIDQYTWTPTPDAVSADGSVATYNSLDAAASYTVSASTTDGCVSIDYSKSVAVVVAPVPSVAFYNYSDQSEIKTKVCAGTMYYPLFNNASAQTVTAAKVSPNEDYVTYCPIDTFYFQVDGGDAQKVYIDASSEGNANKQINGTLNQNTNFSYWAVSSCGCKSDVQTASLSVAESPVIKLTSDVDKFCDGTTASVKLTATASGLDDQNMTWSWPDANTSDIVSTNTSSVATVSVKTPSTFRVMGSNEFGCSASAEVSVSTIDAPTFELTTDMEAVCDGGSTVAHVMNPSTDIIEYNWSDGSDNTKADATLNVNGSSSISVYVVSSDNCKSETKSIEVSAIEHPVPSLMLMRASDNTDITANPVLCPGDVFYPVFIGNESTNCLDTFYVSADGVNYVSVSAMPGLKANELGGVSFLANADATYYYYAKSSCGCSSGDPLTFNIKLASIPTISIESTTGKNTLCADYTGSVTLQASSSSAEDLEWLWNDNSTEKTLTIPSFQYSLFSQEYSVTATTAQNCKTSATFKFDSIPLPVAVISGDRQVCKASEATMLSENSSTVYGTIEEYLWSTSETTSSIKSQIDESGTSFWLKVKNTEGCWSKQSEPWTVDITSNPTIDFTYDGIGGKSIVCDGSELRIQPTVHNLNATYKWYSDVNHTIELTTSDETVKGITDDGSILTVVPKEEQTDYYVVATLNGCQGSALATAQSKANPIFKYAGETWKCEGESLTLTASAVSPTDNYTFVWDNGTYTGPEYIISKVSSSYSTIHVDAYDADKCYSGQDIHIDVASRPVLKIEDSPSICYGESATISVSGADNYRLYLESDKNTILKNSDDGSFTLDNLTESQRYFIKAGYDNSSCIDTGYVSVVVKPLPVITLQNTTIDNKVLVCQNDSVGLRVEGASTYDWKDIEAKHIVNGNLAYVAPSEDATYSVTGTLDGCKSSLDIDVAVTKVPIISLTASQTGVCFGGTVDLNATVDGSSDKVAGYTYTWSDDINANDLTRTALPVERTMTYRLTVSNGGDCVGSSDVTVNMFSNPVAEFSSDLSTVCADSTAVLTAQVSNGTAPYTYQWYINDNDILSTDPTYTTEALTERTTYHLLVSDENNCKSEVAQKTIAVQAKPTIRNTEGTGYCLGNAVRVLLFGANEYLYDGMNQWTSKSDSVFTPDVAGEYTLKVTGRDNLNGTANRYCVSEPITIVDHVGSAPQFDLTTDAPDNALCFGSSANLNVENVVAENAYTISWAEFKDETASTVNTGSVTLNSTYKATLTDNVTLCPATKSVSLSVNALPTTKITLDRSYVCQDSTINLKASADGSSAATPDYKYTWTFTDAEGNVKNYTDESVDYIVTSNTVVTLSAEDANGCVTKSPATSHLYMYSNPVISTSSPVKYCDYDTVRLALNGASKYFIDDQPMTSSDSSFYKPVGSYSYTIVGRNNLGITGKYCYSKPITYTFDVMTSPVATITGDQAICVGATHSLQAHVDNVTDGELHYDWSFDEGNDNSQVDITIGSETPFILRVNDSKSGCYTQVMDTLRVYSLPTVKISAPDNALICSGESIELSAIPAPAGQYDYNWTRSDDASFSKSDSVITESLTASATYSLTITDKNGCTSDATSQIVNVNANPVVSYMGNNTVCQNATLNLTFTGASKYLVDDVLCPTNIYSTQFAKSGANTIKLVGYNIISNGHMCYSDPLPITIEATSAPDLTLVGDTDICRGDAFTLTASGAATYEWSVDNDLDAANDVFSLIPSGAADDTYSYSVKGTGDNGCSTEKHFTVRTNSVPNFSLTKLDADGNNVTSFCEPVEVDINTVVDDPSVDVSGWTYTWYADDVEISGENGFNLHHLFSSTETVKVVATTAVGCSGTQSVKVSELDKPKFYLEYALNSESGYSTQHVLENNLLNVCIDDKARVYAYTTADGPGITAYYWDGVKGNYFSYPTETGTYEVTAEAANGCKSSLTYDVQVRPLPTISIYPDDDSKCLDDAVVLTAKGGESYEWPQFINFYGDKKSVTCNKQGENWFYIVGYSEYGCKNEDSTVVNVNLPPTLKLDPITSFVCLGDKIDIRSTLMSEVEGRLSDYSVEMSYYPVTNRDEIEVLRSQRLNSASLSYDYRGNELKQAGSYQVISTLYDGNGCYATDSVIATINTMPVLSLSGIADNENPTICSGDELYLYPLGADEYTWTLDGTASKTYYTGDYYLVTPTENVTYTLTGNYVYPVPGMTNDTLRCSSSKNISVAVNDKPTISIDGDSVLCYGEGVKLWANGLDLSMAGTSYQWDGYPAFSDTLTDQFVAAVGQKVTYGVTGTDQNGCYNTAKRTVEMRAKPVIVVTAKDANVCDGDSVFGYVSGNNIVNYVWSDGTIGDTVRALYNKAISRADTIKYYVTATDNNNCSIKDSVSFKIQPRFTLADATTEHFVCRGGQVELLATGASSYVWDNDPTLAQHRLTISPKGDETHTVIGKLGVCYDTMDVNIGLLPTPVVKVAGTTDAICLGSQVKLYPDYDNSDVGTYSWSYTAASTFSLDTLICGLTRDSKFVLWIVGDNGCVGSDTASVKVNNLPILKLVGDTTLCENSTTNFSATGAQSYDWVVLDGSGTRQTTDSYEFTSDNTVKSIRVIGTDANNCVDSLQFSVLPTARPSFSIQGDKSICQNNTVALNVVNDATSCNYTWQDTIKGTRLTTVLTEPGTQTFTVVAELNSKKGCTTTETYDVEVKPQPSFDITTKGSLCQNAHLSVTATGADQYVWSSNPKDTINATSSTYERDIVSYSPFSINLAGWLDGCRADSVLAFSVSRAVPVSVSSDYDAVCAGGDVTLTAVSKATKFIWSDDWNNTYDDTTNVLTTPVSQMTTFKVKSVTSEGCMDSTTITVDVSASPTIRMYASPNYEGMQYVADGGVVKICKGSPISISANGAKTFNWSYGSSTTSEQTFNIDSVTENTTVTLNATFASCSASQSFQIEVMDLPEPVISGDLSACRDSMVKLEVSGVDSCSWTGVVGAYGEKNTKLSYAMLYSPVNASVTGYAANGCYKTIPFTLTYNLPPVVKFADYNGDICVGQADTFKVDSPSDTLTYTWNGGDFTGEAYPYVADNAGRDTVRLRATNAKGCYADAFVTVMAHNKPYLSFSAYGDADYAAVNADSSIQICQNTNLYVYGLGASSYVWETSEGRDTLAGNYTVFKPSQNDTYTLYGKDDYGCESSREITVTVNEIPQLTSALGEPDIDGYIKVGVCDGDTVTLDINGADSYVWSTGETVNSITVTPRVSRTYSVVGTSSKIACPANIEFQVTVNPHPTVSVYDLEGRMARTSVCTNTDFSLVAQGCDFYDWYNGESKINDTDTLTYQVDETTVLKVVGRDTNGCSSTSEYTVNAIQSPTISYSPSNLSICNGSTVTIYGLGSANNWYWVAGEDTIVNSKITVSPTTDTTYTVHGSNRYGCSAELDVPVTVLASPVITVDGLADEDGDGVTDTLKACMYNELTLSVDGDCDKFEWSTGTTGNSYTISSLLLNRTYVVKGTASNGCVTSVNIPVEIVKQAKIQIAATEHVCKGNTDTMTFVTEAGAFDTYTWSNGETGDTAVFTINSDTTITLKAYSSATMCENTASYTVYAKPLPDASIDAPAEVCRGSKAEIYAQGANSFIWDDGTEGYARTVKVDADTTFKVFATLDGCLDSVETTIKIADAPDVTFSGDTSVCVGDSVHLVAENAYRYEWSNGVHTAEMSALISDTANYTLTGYNEAGCPTSIDVKVIALGWPRVMIEGKSGICFNDSTDLAAVVISSNPADDDATNAYKWYVNDSLVSQDSIIKYTVTERSTTFTLVGYDKAGCSAKSSYTVAGYSLPKIGLTGPDSICVGTDASYFASNAASYVWVVDGDSTEGNHFKTTTEDSLKIALTAISSQGCKSDSTFTLYAVQSPEIGVKGDTVVCRGNYAVIYGTGGARYEWSNGSDVDSIRFMPSATSEYQVTGYNEAGCSTLYSFTVEVKELPKFDAYASNNSICPGDSASLLAAPLNKDDAYTYYWTNTDSSFTDEGSKVAFMMQKTDEFTARAVDTFGCELTQTVPVYVYEIPEIRVEGDTDICKGDTMFLVAIGADTRFYEWTSSNGDSLGNEPELKFMPTKSDYVTVKGRIANCMSSVEVPYIVNELPKVTMTISDTMICRGDSIKLTAKGADTYKWNIGSSLTNLTVIPAKSSVYTVTGYNEFGCKASASNHVEIVELPKIRIKANKSLVCAGALDTVHLSVVSNKELADYLWMSDVFNSDIVAQATLDSIDATFNDTTKVWLTVTDSFGCVSSDTTVIYKYNAPKMTFSIYPSSLTEDNRTVRLTGNTPSEATWTWTLGDGSERTGESVDYTYSLPLQDTFHVSLYAIDAHGCEYTADTAVYKWHGFWCPEAFSPNGDNVNETFFFRAAEFYEDFTYIIYNRMGEIVFKGDSPTDAWDGTYKGHKCPAGIYGWTATYKGGKSKGSIALLRRKD